MQQPCKDFGLLPSAQIEFSNQFSSANGPFSGTTCYMCHGPVVPVPCLYIRLLAERNYLVPNKTDA